MALRAASSRLLLAATPRTAAPAAGGGLLDASIRPPTADAASSACAHELGTASINAFGIRHRDNRHGQYLRTLTTVSTTAAGSSSGQQQQPATVEPVQYTTYLMRVVRCCPLRAPTIAPLLGTPRAQLRAPSSPVHGTLDVGLSRADANGYARSLPGAALRRPACCLQASRRWTESGRAVCSLVEDDVHSC